MIAATIFKKAVAWTRDCAGAAAVEFAIIAPMLMTLLFGIAEVSSAYQVKQRMARVDLTLADLVGRSATLNASQVDDIFRAADLLMAPFSTDNLTISIRAIEIDSDGTGRILWAHRNDGEPGSMTAIAAMPEGMGTDRQLLEISTSYPFDMNIAFIEAMTLEFGQTSYIRPRSTSLDSWNVGS